jgi:hypothetical protein
MQAAAFIFPLSTNTIETIKTSKARATIRTISVTTGTALQGEHFFVVLAKPRFLHDGDGIAAGLCAAFALSLLAHSHWCIQAIFPRINPLAH